MKGYAYGKKEAAEQDFGEAKDVIFGDVKGGCPHAEVYEKAEYKEGG